MRIIAPAKLNLSLHITGKRQDGYHLLDSLIAFTEFGDELEIDNAEKLSLEISGDFAAGLSAENNLVIRAARLLQQHAGRDIGARIVLNKNIPIGAGLGGGSSDAAAAMLGLCDLWDLDIDKKSLAQMALPLGSDVPACIMQSAAWLSGIGEKIEPVAIECDIWAVLVNPLKPLLTADVYKSFSGDFSEPLKHWGIIENFDHLLEIINPSHNDLQETALKLLPQIKDILSQISSTAGCVFVRMSGSGATCYGLYKTKEEAASALSKIKSANPSWWCVATRISR